MFSLILTVLLLTVPQVAAADADPRFGIEAAELAQRHNATVLCETQPRPASETVQACADRRIGTLAHNASHPLRVYPEIAGPARETCEADGLAEDETLGACIVRVMADDSARDREAVFGTGVDLTSGFDAALDASYRANPPRPEPREPPRERCERQASEHRDDYGSSSSFSIVCSTGDDANGNAARDLLDSMRERQDRSTPRH